MTVAYFCSGTRQLVISQTEDYRRIVFVIVMVVITFLVFNFLLSLGGVA